MDPARKTRAVRDRLLRWYRRCRRDLPWRGLRDPYAIWVSEVMLQQTRAATVGPYFERFLRRFPDVAALAGAHLEAVLKAWEGMGYYARARNLHRAARHIVGDHAGRLPKTAAELRELPGVGPYTAAAVASIAFGRDEPVLDGNVTRVLCRLFGVAADPRTGRTRRRLADLARRLLPPGKAGTFNQALMDLGAVVCRPRRPLCDGCPLSALCHARARGQQDRLPRKAPRKALPHQTVVVGVIRRAGRILIDRRHDEGLLGGLWELPGGKVEKGETLADALRREVREEVGLEVAVGEPLLTVRHAYSHFRVTLHVFQCRRPTGRARALACAAVRWVRPADLDRYPFPAANRRILAALTGTGGAHPLGKP